jgi:hypothetical protein
VQKLFFTYTSMNVAKHKNDTDSCPSSGLRIAAIMD